MSLSPEEKEFAKASVEVSQIDTGSKLEPQKTHQHQFLSDTDKSLDELTKERETNRSIEMFETSHADVKHPKFLPNQSVVAVAFSHLKQRPASKTPGLCILGTFGNDKQAVAHVKRALQNSDISVFTFAVHGLTPICKSAENQSQLEKLNERVETCANAWKKYCDESKADLQNNIDEKKTGKTNVSIWAKRDFIRGIDTPLDKQLKKEGKTRNMAQIPDKLKKQKQRATARQKVVDSLVSKNLKDLPETSSIPGSATLANQKYAVIVYVPDLSEKAIRNASDAEPLVAVLACFNELDDAKTYAHGRAKKEYPLCLIFTVDMYSWIFPENLSCADFEQMEEFHGHEVIDRIMTNRKQNNAEAEEKQNEYEQQLQADQEAQDNLMKQKQIKNE